MTSNVLLIPAYEASNVLLDLVNELSKSFPKIIIVNDGSKLESSKKIFSKLNKIKNVYLLNHTSNLGKGAALKTGLFFAIKNLDFDFIITLDADGQHLSRDVVRLSDYTENHKNISLVLGVRNFDKNVPIRSRMGNVLTSLIFKCVYGYDTPDTQTGLRAIKRSIVHEITNLSSNGYNFEIDVLIFLIKNKLEISTVNITTVYLNGNKTSHFKPISDSIQIYRSILAFSTISFLCFIIDFCLFLILLFISNSIFIAVMISRCMSGCINFYLNRKLFLANNSQKKKQSIFYLVLFLINLFSSYLGIYTLTSIGVSIVLSKVLMDTFLFFGSFLFQRQFFYSRK